MLAAIQRDGFDTRLAKDTGALGAAAYYARDVSYALSYAKQVTILHSDNAAPFSFPLMETHLHAGRRRRTFYCA